MRRSRFVWVGAGVVASVMACAGVAPLDRRTLKVSANSTLVARSILPDAARFPNVVEHLALAQEIYDARLTELQDRRSSVRSRTRALDAAAFGTFAASGLGVGITAIATGPRSAPSNLEGAGYAALSGLALGTLLKVFGFMQEDAAAIDGKTMRLQGAYRAMLDELNHLALQGEATTELEARMAAAIEGFIAEAMQIDVKG